MFKLQLKDAETAIKAIEDDLESLCDYMPVLTITSVNQLVEDYASKALEVHFLDALLGEIYFWMSLLWNYFF